MDKCILYKFVKYKFLLLVVLCLVCTTGSAQNGNDCRD